MAATSYGMGSGTPGQELERWIREAGRITVHDEGEQHQLFDARPVRVYRLYNRAGESITLTAETAERYGFRPKQHRAAPAGSGDLFDAAQDGFIFTEEV